VNLESAGVHLSRIQAPVPPRTARGFGTCLQYMQARRRVRAPAFEIPGRGIEGPRLELDFSNSNDVRSRVDTHQLEHSRSFKHTFAPGEIPEGLRYPVRPPTPPLALSPLTIPGFEPWGVGYEISPFSMNPGNAPLQRNLHPGPNAAFFLVCTVR